MKKASAFLVVLAAAAIAAGAATAGNGDGNANKNANGAQTGHFTASYTQAGLGGTFTCGGQRIAKSGANGFVKDEEECTISDGASFFPAGIDVGNPYYVFHGVHWFWQSDFDGHVASLVTFIVSPTQPDGSAHVKIIAYY
jgi:hypothetical protein